MWKNVLIIHVGYLSWKVSQIIICSVFRLQTDLIGCALNSFGSNVTYKLFMPNSCMCMYVHVCICAYTHMCTCACRGHRTPKVVFLRSLIFKNVFYLFLSVFFWTFSTGRPITRTLYFHVNMAYLLLFHFWFEWGSEIVSKRPQFTKLSVIQQRFKSRQFAPASPSLPLHCDSAAPEGGETLSHRCPEWQQTERANVTLVVKMSLHVGLFPSFSALWLALG